LVEVLTFTDTVACIGSYSFSTAVAPRFRTRHA
jgi:hypothetical protein